MTDELPKELPFYLRKMFLDIVGDQPKLEAVMLDMGAYADRQVKPGEKSPFLDAEYSHKFLDGIHKEFNVKASAGGYFENRAKLWQGSYLEEANAFHLAIDVNLPANTPMTVRFPSIVEKVQTHSWKVGGWGTITAFRLEQPIGDITHFLYGHMADDILVKPGERVVPGQVIGRLGTEAQNGGWFEHGHYQAFSAEGWEKSNHADLENEKVFDGYGYNTPENRRRYPDPMPILGAFSKVPAIKL